MSKATYVYHAVQTQARCWASVSQTLQSSAKRAFNASGACLYGAFRTQIGRPRDELSLISYWPNGYDAKAEKAWLASAGDEIVSATSRTMSPTLRPNEFHPPRRQGNFAFRWFETPQHHYDEFLSLCEAAWPNFEASYDSQILGLWRFEDTAQDATNNVHTLLLTRRPDLAMWERSKIPAGDVEVELRRKLTRRYELCDATSVFTTTLLSANDKADEVNWS